MDYFSYVPFISLKMKVNVAGKSEIVLLEQYLKYFICLYSAFSVDKNGYSHLLFPCVTFYADESQFEIIIIVKVVLPFTVSNVTITCIHFNYCT